MSNAQTAETTQRKPLRLWPGVLAAVLLLLVRYVAPIVVPEALYIGVMGGMAGGLIIIVWWVFFSRVPWLERLGAVGLMIVAVFATPYILHESIATGAMGMLFYILSIPILSLAFVGWAVASRNLSNVPRRVSMVATIVLACGVWALIRTGGFTSDLDHDFAWRWTETSEERLLAQAKDEPLDSARGGPATLASAPAAVETPQEQLLANANAAPTSPSSTPATAKTLPKQHLTQVSEKPAALAATTKIETEVDWPGFRGPNRDDIIRGVRIETDWSATPPIELWRRPIGPGWSSFAVRGGLLYTQEQRGEEEVVVCYNATTGQPVWMHRDSTRFWESNGGAGPRGTPTLSNGRVYTFGATGILNVLDARDGSVVWSRNAASDAKTKTPIWGYSSSPSVVDDLVIVASSGRLVAYDLATGNPRWFGPDSGGASYSSPQLLTIDGVEQILLLNAAGLTSVATTDGAVLWQHSWEGYPIVQPTMTADGDVLISVSSESGVRRLAVAHGPGGWTVEERWTSKGLKPYYSDMIVHDGHAFGFDGSLLACIDVADGKRKWKGGRYGAGQIFLLADQDLLLVLSEQGELALVNAASDKFTELARFPAIEGKTWNHPVLVGDVLLVRNGEEMVAFRLALARS